MLRTIWQFGGCFYSCFNRVCKLHQSWCVTIQSTKIYWCLLCPKETPIPKTPRAAPDIQKWAQPGLLEDFWRVDKSQHSSETCEADSPLPKGVISLMTDSRDKWLPVVCITTIRHMPPLGSFVSQVPVTHFKVHASVLGLLPPLL